MNGAIEWFSANLMYVMLTIGTIFNIFWVLNLFRNTKIEMMIYRDKIVSFFVDII